MAATLVWRLTGGASNSDPNASLGGIMSSNALSETALNNLFDDVSAAEAVAGDIEYRAVDLYNSGDETATSVTAWFHSQTSSPDTAAAMGKDASSGDPHAAAADLETIANESTAPSSPTVTFTEATEGAPLYITDIPAGQACRVWIRRTVSSGAGNTSNDTMTLRAQYA